MFFRNGTIRRRTVETYCGGEAGGPIRKGVPSGTEGMNAFLKIASLLLIGLLSVGCQEETYEVPETVSIEGDFSEVQIAAIEDVIDSWCESAAFCLEIVESHGDLRIIADNDFARHGEADGVAAIHEFDDAAIYVDMSLTFMTDDVAWFWRVIAHEVGHSGVGPDHLEHGAHPDLSEAEFDGLIMSLETVDGPLTIDAESVAWWKASAGR
jgi:hypothetical protein